MKDYLITLTVKNNILLSAMKGCGFKTAVSLARTANVGPEIVGMYLNLKMSPYSTNGLRPSILRISKTLKILPEDLFPPQHLTEGLKKNVATVEMSRQDVEHMLAYTSNPEELLEFKEMSGKIRTLLSLLKPREEKILRDRFGLDGPVKTLHECGKEFGVDRERIRQIEAKALRKLRHQTRLDRLVEYVA